MARKQYVITVDSDADADAVAAELRSRGLQVDHVMREIHAISASGEGSDIQSVRTLKGVSNVDESVDYHIPPPDSPIQ